MTKKMWLLLLVKIIFVVLDNCTMTRLKTNSISQSNTYFFPRSSNVNKEEEIVGNFYPCNYNLFITDVLNTSEYE